MKKEKNYIPISKQAKANSFQNFVAISSWLLFFYLIAVITEFVFATFLPDSQFYILMDNKTQFVYTIWSIQASVTVLSFFISNIMTSIVKDVFYGLSIKDILTSRVKTFEISFWNQASMSIILVILNTPFVILGFKIAALVIAIANLLFIVYMINNAFRYVFNRKAIVNRVDKLIRKEILTGKTILSIDVFIKAIENDTINNVNHNDLRKATYNIYFMLRTYGLLKENTRTDQVKSMLLSLKKVLLYLVRKNQFETLNHVLNNHIEKELTEEEYSDLTCTLIEAVSTRFINYSMLDITENSIDEQLIKWSKLKGNNELLDSISSSLHNYYHSVLLNRNISATTRDALINKLFDTLTLDSKEHNTEAFKISLLLILKDMVVNNNQQQYKNLLNVLNQLEVNNSSYFSELIALINLYLFYIAFNEKVNNTIKTQAKEFLHIQAITMEGASKSIAQMLKESNARFIKHFWQVVNTVTNYNAGAKLSLTKNSNYFDAEVLTEFYLIYWKLFANSLENINLNQADENTNYNLILFNLIKNVKDDEIKDYTLFKNFCEVYEVDYDELKTKDNWVDNADKIDEYIRDIYIDNLTTSTVNTLSRLTLLGTLKQERRLLKEFKQASRKLPLFNNIIKDSKEEMVTVPFVMNINKLAINNFNDEIVGEYNNKFKQVGIEQINGLLSKLRPRLLNYNKDQTNLKKLFKKLDELEVNAMTHTFSNNIDLLNNERDAGYVNQLIDKETNYTLLNELELNKYLFFNLKSSKVKLSPQEVKFRKPTDKELDDILKANRRKTRKPNNKYVIGNYYGSKAQALNYYSNLYLIMDVDIKVIHKLDKTKVLKVNI